MPENKKYYRQWATCYAMLGDDFSYVSIDLGYLRLLPIPEKGNTLRVLVSLTAPKEDGLPGTNEKIVLDKIGQALNESINAVIDASYVGFIASDKQCGFYFCIGSIFMQEQAIYETMLHFPEYQYETYVIEDDNWDVYTGCLFPSYQHYELVQHSSVITQLEEGGDPLTKPRSVDHWFYFRNESDRENFIESVCREGFHIEEYYEDHPGEWPFGVQISRVDLVDRQNLFKYAPHLWNLAYEHYGNYDGWETSVEKE